MEKNKILAAVLLVFFLAPFAFAQTTDQITAPLTKIYDLIKAAVAVIGIIALTIAGARFMFAGENMQAREAAKNMATYAIIGLVMVWVAPVVVQYLTAPA
ncbi:MAG: TrbC/VirB2 family protein [Candidatus Micrarchaeota archaeon]